MTNVIRRWQFWVIVVVVLATTGLVCWKMAAENSQPASVDVETQEAANFIESSFSATESEIIALYSEYGVTAVEGYGIALNTNSYPSISSGEAVSTAFSWADKNAGTYSFSKDAAKKELMKESLNPIWVSARCQALFERNDPIVAYLTKTKAAEQKLKLKASLKYWLKKDDKGNPVLKDGKYFLTEEYLQIALVMFRLGNDEMAFSTECSIETVANPVVIWRKTILTDAQTVLNDLTVRKDKYSEEEKWDDVLKVVQRTKDGTIISTELFNVYDKAPIIPQKATPKQTAVTTTSSGGSGGGGGGDTPTPGPTPTPDPDPVKDPSQDPVYQGNAEKLGGSNKSTDGTGTFQPTRPEQATDTRHVGDSSSSTPSYTPSGSTHVDNPGIPDNSSGTGSSSYGGGTVVTGGGSSDVVDGTVDDPF